MNTSQDRYEKFAQEYVIDLNATRAAIAAGYSEKSAFVQASNLLKKPKVRELVDKLLSKRASKMEIKAERVIEELSRLAFSNMADYMEVDSEGKPVGIDLRKLTRDQAACIQEITEDSTGGIGDGERRLVIRRRFKLADKTKNLELLCRHLGMFNDKIQVSGLEGLAERLNKMRKQEDGDASAAA